MKNYFLKGIYMMTILKKSEFQAVVQMEIVGFRRSMEEICLVPVSETVTWILPPAPAVNLAAVQLLHPLWQVGKQSFKPYRSAVIMELTIPDNLGHALYFQS